MPKDPQAHVRVTYSLEQAEGEKQEQHLPEFSREIGQQYMELFGERGAAWYLQGKSLTECFQLAVAELTAERQALAEQNEDLLKRLEAATSFSAGEKEPLDGRPGPETTEKQQRANGYGKQLGSKGLGALAAHFEAKLRR